MKVKCQYCGYTYEMEEDKCPGCGAPNESSVAGTHIVKDPVTIEELQEWYQKRGLPPEDVTRFFIGKDYKGAKAFGIYRDTATGNVVVYKNKADGSRAVRYNGPDEAVAVREILLKLKETISQQKSANRNRQNQGNTGRSGGSYDGSSGRSRKKSKKGFHFSDVIGLSLFLFVMAGIFAMSKSPSRGYYTYHDNTYYKLSDNWYMYDAEANDWYRTDEPFESGENWKDYYDTSYKSESYDQYRFEDTEFYSDWEAQQSSHDSDDNDYDSDDDDYDWDSGDSWDSDAGDWDSDW
ncbi:MAG: hypothetical protein II799_05200 [Lachnospiraceae bacterium]|nr:hypothetical protein [Lachnospiraceae bacterium]